MLAFFFFLLCTLELKVLTNICRVLPWKISGVSYGSFMPKSNSFLVFLVSISQPENNNEVFSNCQMKGSWNFHHTNVEDGSSQMEHQDETFSD